ncbi:TrbI/VirB10 family protein [Tabrizicola sp.]|uniref:TrbI/VirB10 family protein n=1 Tax=Tabrizicola sp. TaxID=2005166 RepID=UPI003F2DAE4A
MAETPDQEARLAARLEALKGPGKKRRGVNPWVLSAVTGVAGLGLGAWIVAFAPEPGAEEGLPASTATEFQEDAGLDGFRIREDEAPALPQVAPTAEDPELAALRATVANLQAEIARLRANPETVTVADEAALAALQTRIDEVESASAAREAALQEAEIENERLRAQIEAGALLADEESAAREAAARREEELARRRAEAEALEAARVNSEMVAFRDGASGGGPETEAAREASGNAAFLREGAGRAEVRSAEIIANPGSTLVQGTLIEAALETAISTDLAGNVVAQVSHDVWSFDMSRVLVPRGAKLYGRYDSDTDLGQRRVLIAWDRLVTPDGQSVALAAYGTDAVGRSGLPGTVRTHFLKRFGSAALISIIGAAPAVAAAHVEDEAAADAGEDVGDGFAESLGTVLGDYLTIAPTIYVNQGTVVLIRVDADIEMF